MEDNTQDNIIYNEKKVWELPTITQISVKETKSAIYTNVAENLFEGGSELN